MQGNWLPIPHSWREAIYLAIAIILATSYKRLSNGIAGFWRDFRLGPARADKIHAEAESIRTNDVVGTAQLIREMSVSLGQATILTGQLKEKIASQESIIALQKVKIEELESRKPETKQA